MIMMVVIVTYDYFLVNNTSMNSVFSLYIPYNTATMLCHE
jgi:hypothetical protein